MPVSPSTPAITPPTIDRKVRLHKRKKKADQETIMQCCTKNEHNLSEKLQRSQRMIDTDGWTDDLY